MRFEKRQLLIELEKRTLDKKTGHISFQFQIGPFKKTMGTTIGSALRRTLLSLSKNVTITSANGFFHDGNCIREDLFELSLNLQKINIKSTFFPYSGTGKIKKIGPAIITAQDILLEEGLEVVNPYQYICTLNEGYTLDLLLMISSANFTQSLSSENPGAHFIPSHEEGLKERENNLFSIVRKKSQSYLHQLESSITNSDVIKAIQSTRHFWTKKERAKTQENLETNEKSLGIAYSSIKKGTSLILKRPQKVPFDIVMVDPIFSAIQSCGFEITHTIRSSVVEYEELIKKGIAQTDEFLRFVVISRGTVEPVLAIEFALEELRKTLCILDPLPKVVSRQKTPLLLLGPQKKFTHLQTKKELLTSYLSQLILSLDIAHLSLPVKLELYLRREGFVNIQNLHSVPLEFLKRIGLTKKDVQVIQKSFHKLGISSTIDEDFIWDLIPEGIPKL